MPTTAEINEAGNNFIADVATAGEKINGPAGNVTDRHGTTTKNLQKILAELEGMGATLYDSEAIGLANTVDGDLFMVKGTGNVFASLFKNVAGSAVDQNLELPSYDYVAALYNIIQSMGATLYDSEALGLAGTADGDLFMVKGTGNVFASLFMNVAGSAVDQNFAIPSYNYVVTALYEITQSMGATLYDSEAAGLASTVDGNLFMVKGTGNVFASLFRNVADSAVNQNLELPSYDYVAALYETTQSAEGVALIKVNNEVALALRDTGVDFVPSQNLRKRLGINGVLNETWIIAADGQSRLGSTASTVDEVPNIRRLDQRILMPGNGLGIHQLSLTVNSLKNGLGNEVDEFGDFNFFVPADERVNPKPPGGGGPLQSMVIPTAETLALTLKTNVPQLLAFNVGQNAQPLIQGSTVEEEDEIGLWKDKNGNLSGLFNHKMDMIEKAYNIALAEGQPLTKIFFTFDWGESEPNYSRSTTETEVSGYFAATEAAIAAIDSSIEVHWFVTQPGGNTTRNNYEYRLGILDVAAAADNVHLVGASFYKLTDEVHPTNHSKAIAGTRYGLAMASVVAGTMWKHPTWTFDQGTTVSTLTSDVALEISAELSVGASIKGFYLESSTASITDVSFSDGRIITITYDVAPSPGDVLTYAYRTAIGAEAEPVGQPIGYGPFVLAMQKAVSPILPGYMVNIHVPGNTWEFV